MIPQRDGSKDGLEIKAKARVVDAIVGRLKNDDNVGVYAAALMRDRARQMEATNAGHGYDDPVSMWVDSVVRGWAEMDNPKIAAINKAVSEVYGVPWHYGGPTERPMFNELMRNLYTAKTMDYEVDQYVGRDAYQSLVKAIYAETQATLADMPDGQMIFFRGLRGREYSAELNDGMDGWIDALDTDWATEKPNMVYQDLNIPVNSRFPGVVYTDAQLSGRPVASWSASYSTAKDFAQNGVILMVSVPKAAVFSTAQTGPGALFEDEVLLLDRRDNVVTAVSARQTNASFDLTSLEAGQRGALDMPYGIVHPATHNSRKTKIAWSEAYVDAFHQRGVWVDLMEEPVANSETYTDFVERYQPDE